MTRRALSPSLVVAAVLADAQGEHRLAFYALFAAIPALAVAAIGAFGDYLEGSSPIFVWVNSLALVLVVAGTALRAPALAQDRVPTVALSALVLVVCVLAAQSVLELARGWLERQRPRRVAGQVD
ncbi:MAG TPA: hypothetical protein VF101_17455 [Gaiellaceae bacterium]